MTKTPKDIAAMSAKIKAFEQKKALKEAEISESSRDKGAVTGFQLSIELVAGVLVGAAMGYFLDSVFNTRPVLLAFLTVLGGAAGVLNIYKSSKEEFKD